MDEKRDIHFTQYLLPDGRQSPVTIARPVAIADLADKIVAAGFRFECEILTTREVSVSITNDEEGDAAIAVVPNGPEVPPAIDAMITAFATERGIVR